MAYSKFIISLGLLSNLALANKITPRVCDDKSTFLLSDLDFESSHVYSTPSHLASSSATVSFTLSNSVGEYDLDCEANSTQHSNYFDGTKVYVCGDKDSTEPTPFAANFTFSRPLNTFDITATWGCYNFVTRKYESYSGKANGSIPLVCDDKKYQNKNWTAGAIYSSVRTTCDTAELELYPITKLVKATPLVSPKAVTPKAPVPPKAPAASASPKAPLPPKAPVPVPAPPKAPFPGFPQFPGFPKAPTPPASPKAGVPPPKAGTLPKASPSNAIKTNPWDDDDDDEDDEDEKRRYTTQVQW